MPRALDGERLDRVISLVCGVARREASALVAEGAVRLGGRTMASRAHRVSEGDVVEIALGASDPPEPVADRAVEVPVVYADDHVVVVDKPAGVAVHPGAGRPEGTLVNGLLARFPDLAAVGEPARPGIVHRLDIGTSGLLVVARTASAYASLVAQLSSRTAERHYLALAWGAFESTGGVIDAPVGRGGRDRTQMAVSARGKEARTRYRVADVYRLPAAATLLECRLETGRTHQVRVHLAAIGHPLVGDRKYGGARLSVPLKRPFLHAHRLAFDHPASGERRWFASPLPADLEEARELFR